MNEQPTFKDGAPNYNDEIDLGQLLATLMDGKWWIIATTLVFAMLGSLFATLQKPQFQGDAMVLVERRSTLSPLGDLSSVLGEGIDVSTSAEIQILQSRMVLGQVVDRLNLSMSVEPKVLPIVGYYIQREQIARPAVMQGRPEVWGGEHISVSRMTIDDSLHGRTLRLRILDPQSFELAWANGSDALGTFQVAQDIQLANGLIELRVAELNAPSGAEFLLQQRPRTLAVRQLANRLSVSEVGGSRTGTGMLKLTITGPDRTELRQSLNGVIETFLMQNVERQSEQADRSLEFLSEQIPLLRDQLTGLEDTLNQFRIEQDSIDLSSESRLVIDQFIALERQLNDLEFQATEMLTRLTVNHPNYQSLMRQKAQLESQLVSLNERINELPSAQQEITRRTRDVEVTQAIYVNVLNRSQELEIARAGTLGNIRIIDDAVVGSSPVAPRRSLIVMVATLLGGMLSVLAILLKSALNHGIKSPDELEQSGLSVYATVWYSKKQKELSKQVKRLNKKTLQSDIQGVLAERDPTDMSIEAMRGLRTSLHFAMMEAPDNRLVITGATTGAGKSFIAINLAAVCAMAGQKVLLVDADLRKGLMHHAFQKKAEPGLSEVLSGRTHLSDAIAHSSVAGLDVLTCGSLPPNPSELLMSAKFKLVMADLSASYDLVILDTPPILAVTDAAIIGGSSGTTLVTVRYRLNTVREILAAKIRLEDSGVRVKGTILNGFEQKHSAYRGYGYHDSHYAYK